MCRGPRAAEWAYDHYGRRTNGQGEVLELERALAPALFSAEQRGIPLDVKAAHEFRAQVRASMEAARARAGGLADTSDFNISASAALIEAFERRGVDLETFRGRRRRPVRRASPRTTSS